MSEVGGVEFGRGDNPLNFLVEEEDSFEHSWEWAVVTGSDPLRIRFENEPSPLNLTPDSLIPPPPVGTRVRAVIYGRNVLVVGAARGGIGGGGAGAYVPWNVPGESVRYGEGTDVEPSLQLVRTFPTFEATAYLYVANSSVAQGALMIRHDGENQAAFRFNEDATLSISDYGAGGTRPLPYAVAAGSRVLSVSGGIGSVRITLPSGRFTQAPNVFATGNSGVGALQNAQVANVTASSFDLVMQRTSTTSTTVYWMAVQMAPTSADG